MTEWRFATALAACVIVFGVSTSSAQDGWRTVVLGSNPDVTISLPLVVVDLHRGGVERPDVLMAFSLSAIGEGDLFCQVNRVTFPAGFNQASVATTFANAPDKLCNKAGPTISGANPLGSKSFTQNDLAATRCFTSYTDSAKESPGVVHSQMTIVADSHIYTLVCVASHEDQDAAETSWFLFWEDTDEEMHRSFFVGR